MEINTDHQLNNITQILKEKKILNSRISKKLTNAKSIQQARHIANIFIEQQNKVLELQQIASVNQIEMGSEFFYALSNIDNCDIKALRKQITQIVEFVKYKQKCYDALSLIPLSQTILNSIKSAKDKVELEKVLYPIPYQVLKKNKLVKSPKDVGLSTKSSVRPISTNMKNQ